MKPIIAAIIAIALLAPAARAQAEGPSLMERGAELFLEGLLKEMQPAIEEFEGLADQMGPALRLFADEMGPKLAEILEEVEDWSAYQAPEILPNGDIIIRRKPDHPLTPPAEKTEPEPQIEL
ncbi:hypothetical protein [Sulfitobacter aestuariivivens]|uniref:AAA+ family ATPase n=1 Tax=Sulfitobacter aestuariivivens TaxID=2766981 RepID=A0A927D1K2_9RHOB|nr:hypothetical protein [Sulfitobacter aestuariivivens]MBD3662706.1 hypothetical protein [Sulfitobacter aestuariivivens]